MIFRAHAHRYMWWGKLLGAGLGFLIAGPIGALFGIFAGNFFDRGLSEHLIKADNAYRIEKSPAIKQAFLRATFLNLGHIAKADGRVSEEEIRLTKKIMQELRLNKHEENAAKNFFNQGKQINFCTKEPLRTFRTLTQDNTKHVHAFIQLQYRMAQIDGLSLKKVTALNILLNELGFAPLHQQSHARHAYQHTFHQNTSWRGNHHQTKQEEQAYNTSQNFDASESLESSYAKLGLSSSATQQEVKRAYRRLMSKHHPDKCIAQGLSERQIKAANEKTQTIRKAYEKICEFKG